MLPIQARESLGPKTSRDQAEVVEHGAPGNAVRVHRNKATMGGSSFSFFGGNPLLVGLKMKTGRYPVP